MRERTGAKIVLHALLEALQLVVETNVKVSLAADRRDELIRATQRNLRALESRKPFDWIAGTHTREQLKGSIHTNVGRNVET